MGFDISSVPEIINMAQNWQTELLPTFLPYLPEVMNGKVSGLMAELGKLGNHFFPTATSADYMDLISWVMGRTPLPDKNNVGAWLVDAMKPMEKKRRRLRIIPIPIIWITNSARSSNIHNSRLEVLMSVFMRIRK